MLSSTETTSTPLRQPLERLKDLIEQASAKQPEICRQLKEHIIEHKTSRVQLVKLFSEYDGSSDEQRNLQRLIAIARVLEELPSNEAGEKAQLQNYFDSISDASSVKLGLATLINFVRLHLITGEMESIALSCAKGYIGLIDRFGPLEHTQGISEVFQCWLLEIDAFRDLAESSKTLKGYMIAVASRSPLDLPFVDASSASNPAVIKVLNKLRSSDRPFDWKELRARLRLGLNPLEALELHLAGESPTHIMKIPDSEQRAQYLYKKLVEHSEGWRPGETVQTKFLAGAERFGFDALFKIIKGKTSRHDSLQGFEGILELSVLAEGHGTSPKKFMHQIIMKACQDSDTYEGQTALVELGRIARLIDFGQNGTQSCLTALGLENRYQNLIKGAWTQSWDSVRELFGYQIIIQESNHYLEKIDSKLKPFIEGLITGASGRVAPSAIKQFIFDPNKFFLRKDSTREYEEVARFNIVDERLGLSATKVREALVDGTFDRLQLISPLRINYEFPKNHQFQNLQQGFRAAINDKLARRPRDLEVKLRDCLKQHSLGEVAPFLAMKKEPEPSAHDALCALLYDKQIGIPDDFIRIVAEIHPKSDGKAARAGDDTVTCKPFGVAKATNYLINPCCASFTLQTVGADFHRTFAETVVVAGIQAVRHLGEEAPAHDLYAGNIAPLALQDQKRVIFGDNIEVEANRRSPIWQNIIKAAHSDALWLLHSTLSKTTPDLSDRISIGRTSEDPLTFSVVFTNESIPALPMLYSDHRAFGVFSLPRIPNLVWKSRVVEIAPSEKSLLPSIQTDGISALTLWDCVPLVISIEKHKRSQRELSSANKKASEPEKSYTLANISRQLLQYDLLTRGFGAQGLGFVHYGEDRSVQAYILAVGSFSKPNVIHLISAGNFGNVHCIQEIAKAFVSACCKSESILGQRIEIECFRQAQSIWPFLKQAFDNAISAGQLSKPPIIKR